MRTLLSVCLRTTAFAAAVAACSSATQRVYIAPSAETIISDTEERQSDPPSHLIFIRNRSTVPVTVFSVSLNSCQNIKGSCGPRRVSIKVAPGQRVTALRVEPANQTLAFSYRFGFSWNADSSGSMARAALGIASELSLEGFRSVAPRVASLRTEPESLVIEPGSEARLERVRLLVVDSGGEVLGQTRWIRWTAPSYGAVRFIPTDRIFARHPGRATVRFTLADEAQQIIGRPIADVVMPVIVAYPVDPHAPVFTGVALDADSRKPLACVRVALEDTARNAVANEQTSHAGTFSLQAPRPGTYRVNLGITGWSSAYGSMELANADEEKQREYLVRFTEQTLMSRDIDDPTGFQHATPAALSTIPVSSNATGRSTAPVGPAVSLSGSAAVPVLGIISRVPPATVWAQFVVDSAGKVDTASIMVPPGTSANVRTNVVTVLPRVRFSAARVDGRPTCEMLRIQVNFSQP